MFGTSDFSIFKIIELFCIGSKSEFRTTLLLKIAFSTRELIILIMENIYFYYFSVKFLYVCMLF